MKKILVIQTAFLGDVILATAVVEKLSQHFPNASIDFLLRKGNESVLQNNPNINQILIWEKRENKYRHFFKLIKNIRAARYDLVVNLQRFSSSGILTVLSNAKVTVGFNKNPFAFLFTKKVKHRFGTNMRHIHEVERNLTLIEHLTDGSFVRPKIYPPPTAYKKAEFIGDYITISPGSVWMTKQWPARKWIQFIEEIKGELTVLLLGGPSEKTLCEAIANATQRSNVIVRAGAFSILESAAVMSGAVMNFVNDSAPLHLASAMNAPVTALFCSTVPAFGFTPLSDDSIVLETKLYLACRPCGLHGKKACPKGHFKCSEIEIKQLLERIK